MRAAVFFLGAFALAGCDKITGAADQKIADAEAVGFACRVAQKQPEACMKENEALSPSSLLDGWKIADEDIKEGKLDPGMSNVASEKKDESAADGEHKPEDAKDGEKPTEAAASGDAGKKDAAAQGADAVEKPAEAAHDKPSH